MKKINKILIVLIVLVIIIFTAIYFLISKTDSLNLMIDLTGKTKEEAIIFADKYNLNLEFKEVSNSYEKDKIFKKSIEENIKKNKKKN